MTLQKPKMTVANKVFAELQKQDLPAGAYSDLYVNGRERGYTVTADDRMVAFSENRNSDQIVVYPGKYTDFDTSGTPLHDSAWFARQYFDNGDNEGAAKFIAAFLRGE